MQWYCMAELPNNQDWDGHKGIGQKSSNWHHINQSFELCDHGKNGGQGARQ